MKNLFKLSLLVLIVMMSCKTENKNELEGAWKMVYAKWVFGDTLKYEFPGNLKIDQVKIWSGKYIVFAGPFTADTTKGNNYGWATYKLDGKKYREVYKGEKDSMVYKMVLEIRNDTLIQCWPADDNGNVDEKNLNIEKYVRLD
ncbi:MAG: hypothetical protein U0W24_09805 [Bacteroidales bacterium]